MASNLQGGQVTNTGTALHDSPWANEGLIRHPQDNNSQIDDADTFNESLSPWCREPPGGDCSTCCEGTFVPCVLFGKTHWRLTQGGNDQDSKWTAAMGCNQHCWSWCCFSVLLCGFGGVFTGLQRTRIRGTYGIKGSVVNDVCIGYWCSLCTQIQNDREVRARGGCQKLRYNRHYIERRQAELVATQPQPTAPMSYTPARQGEMIEMTQFTRKPNKLQKTSPNVGAVENHTGTGDREGMRGVSQQEHHISYKPDKPDKPNKPDKNKGRPTSKKSKDSAKHKDQHSKDHGEANQLRTHAESGLSLVEVSQPSIKNANGSSSTAQENVSDVQAKLKYDLLASKHALMNCVVMGIESDIQAPKRSHKPADCTDLEVDEKTSTLDQHRTSDCHGASSAESEDAQELSYVHDFTDCPVDKAVLDYYENQSRKLQQHSLGEDSRTGSSTAWERKLQQHSLSQDPRTIAPGRKLQQHSLSDDPQIISSAWERKLQQHSLSEDTGVSPFASPGRKLQQHSLSDDARTFAPGGKLQQHSLSNDLRTTAPGGKLQQHSLSDDTRASSFTALQAKSTSKQHTVMECLDFEQAGPSKTARRPNRSASDGTEVTLTKVSNNLQEHRLVSCPTEFTGRSTPEDRSQGSYDSRGSQTPNQKGALTLFPKTQSKEVHIHDENCLTGGLHHSKCALNFEITSSTSKNTRSNESGSSTNLENNTHGKGGIRQKQRRFKRHRRTNETKTPSGSNENTKGHSADRSGQIAHSQASSGSEKKKASHKKPSDELVGFPYSEFQNTKVIVGDIEVHVKPSEEKVVVAVVEGKHNDQEAAPSTVWSKAIGTKG